MKIILLLFCLLLFNIVPAQDVPSDSLKTVDSSSLKIIDTGSIIKTGDTWPGNKIIDNTDGRPHNKYGDLLNDDPA